MKVLVRICYLIIFAAVAGVRSAPGKTSINSGTTLDELLAYQCGRSVATLVRAEDQLGPLFADGILIFTSLEAADGSQILLVNGGYGNYQIYLPEKNINRLNFSIPSAPKGEAKSYYLSYLHGENQRSRYFEYAEGRPPTGHDQQEYRVVAPKRADNLMPHLDYAIHETTVSTLNAMAAGRLIKRSLLHHKVENCDFIARQSPALARNLHDNIDQLETIVLGPKPDLGMQTGRMPASL